MKKVIFFGLIILLIIVACAKQESKFPQGAWQLVQIQRIVDGKAEILFPSRYTGNQYKMWTEKNWIYMTRWSLDTLSGDGFGGGTYTIVGNKYVENIIYHSTKSFEGKSLNMTIELRNDTLIQTYQGVDSNGQIIENQYNVEKYIKWQ